ncbi:hypothetical protein [Aminobacter ciceronei]|uniref:Transcriptional regulator with XRE-family HTH domain n=1 Tax=Aminobacter ciceronei TaxID=150723 RepID=A0ABR6C0V9_9HYPH|nr:hypothetical protein [Aminobacter ciceronei]MBA8904847.1 transcriptional regulator with XRE-family HTH domain [Aminobacter ciceronei]MBA9018599.1 transcriptional regulator with XRE-family HTH domain [Aminobacter ciceronei]
MAKFQRKPPRTASAIIRDMMEIIDQDPRSMETIGKVVGIHPNNLSYWRSGMRSPTLINFENAAQAIGYKLTLVRINDVDSGL